MFQFFLEKNSILVSKSSFYVPTWSFWGRFLWNFFFWIFLENEPSFAILVQTISTKCPNCVQRDHGNSLKKFFVWKILVFVFLSFLTFSDNSPVYCRKFFVTAVRTAFWLSKGTFWENCSSETFFLFVQWAKNFGLSSHKVFAHSSKWHSRRPEAQFGEECFFFWKKTVFFPMLLYLGKECSIFSW